ncbi:MAG: VC2662 family protein [bacterium]
MTRSIACLGLLLSLILLGGREAPAETGFQLGLPNLNVPRDPDVNGFRLSFLYGENRQMRGFDLGLLSVSETSRMSGVALVGGVSRITGEMSSGASFSLVNFHTGRDSGMNAAFINLLDDAGQAFNTGFVTIARGRTGVDLGGINLSEGSKAQIGFVNITKEIESFQLGFLNMAENGFLPVFPFFNFPKD